MADFTDPKWKQVDANNNSPAPDGFGVGINASSVGGAIRAHRGADKRSFDRLNTTVTSTGTATDYAITYEVAPVDYFKGERFGFWLHATNTGAPTLRINGMAPKNLLRSDGSAFAAGDLVAGQPLEVTYDGAAFREFSGVGASAKFAGALSAASISTPGAVTAASVTATTLTGNGAAISNVNAVTLAGNAPAYFQRALTDVNVVELGGTDIGDKPVVIDMHSSNGTDYNARLIRDAGVNNSLSLIQTGTGAINIAGGSNLLRDGNLVYHAGNFAPSSKRDLAITQLAGSADLNGVTATGYYAQQVAAPLAANYPTTNGGVIIVNAAGGAITQIYVGVSASELYVRAHNGTAWLPWKKMNTSTQTISTAAPSGGVHGDVWYKV